MPATHTHRQARISAIFHWSSLQRMWKGVGSNFSDSFVWQFLFPVHLLNSYHICFLFYLTDVFILNVSLHCKFVILFAILSFVGFSRDMLLFMLLLLLLLRQFLKRLVSQTHVPKVDTKYHATAKLVRKCQFVIKLRSNRQLQFFSTFSIVRNFNLVDRYILMCTSNVAYKRWNS